QFPRLSLLDERGWVAEHAELVSRVRRAVEQLTGDEPSAAAATEADLFDFCKLLLVEKTKAWAAKLEERETEINLLAMNVLPSSAFLVVWAVKSVATDPASWPSHGLIPFIGLAVPLLLLRNIYPLQARERQVVFNMFLQHPLLARMDPPKE
ncbi:MAG TPA: hypothetical protein VD866_25640, partial [Urbifossiella sp.]|nr:hypothetical protein [Urbifossiella sp.]